MRRLLLMPILLLLIRTRTVHMISSMTMRKVDMSLSAAAAFVVTNHCLYLGEKPVVPVLKLVVENSRNRL